VQEVEIQAVAVRTSLQVHQARHVRGHDVADPAGADAFQLVVAHRRRDGFLGDRESATESAAFIRPVKVGERVDAMWIVESGVSRGIRTSFRSSFRATDAARWIRLSIAPEAIVPSVPIEQGQITYASTFADPEA